MAHKDRIYYEITIFVDTDLPTDPRSADKQIEALGMGITKFLEVHREALNWHLQTVAPVGEHVGIGNAYYSDEDTLE